jgi:hypothetical protein
MKRDTLFETRGWWPDWALAQHVAIVEHTKQPKEDATAPRPKTGR